jgi:TPP-dependent 2-oxoacid decarboxylase
VILNSPATAASQINRALDVMVRERRPVYIGLSLAVAGQPMPGYSAAAQVPSRTQSNSTADSSCADAGEQNILRKAYMASANRSFSGRYGVHLKISHHKNESPFD